MAVIIGITGGIGSGKSTVCTVFKLLKVPVFEADKVAKELLDTHPEIKSGLVHRFGQNICTENGTIDRRKLAEIIFNDESQLKKMNQLVHPAVRNEFKEWVAKHEQYPYVIHEAAILFESGFYRMMDYTILVSAPREQRIKWVMKRDGVSRQQVEERMKNQMPEEEKQKLATRVLKNNNQQLLIPEIIEIDKNIRKYGKIW
ncbi:MAG: dephospho-CoA kinase [Tangfeifania sp.]